MNEKMNENMNENMNDEILVEVRNYTCCLILNRPQKMNAFNISLLQKLEGIIKELRFNPEVRTLIITGAGDKSFSAGADLKERAGMSHYQVKNFLYRIRNLFTEIENLPIPVIAAINGIALGGGLELALACDIRLACQEALLGLTEVTLGIIPGAGGTQRLTRLAGKSRAKEMIFTGRRVTAVEAVTFGLVDKVVPASHLIKETMSLAEMINNNGPIAVQQAKFAINHGIDVDLASGIAIEAKAYEICLPTNDRLEGLKAFKEKRRPIYKGE